MSTIAPTAATRVLLPFRHLRWRAMVAGQLGCVLPAVVVVLGVALFGGGRPVPAIVLTALVLAVGAAAVVIGARSRVVLTAAGLDAVWTQGRPAVSVPAERVEQAVLRTVHNGDGITADRHLFLLDDAGRTLFRMSDRWWRDADLAAVARHFEVRLVAHAEAVQLAELRRSIPEQLRWRERHGVAATVLTVAAGFAVCLVVAALSVAAL